MMKRTKTETPDWMTIVDHVLVCVDADYSGLLEIPMGVVAVGDHVCMDNGGITSLYIPQTVRKIGFFYHQDFLTEMVVPEGVMKIAAYAFAHCHNLEKITLPTTIQEIAETAFCGCEKLQVIIPQTVMQKCGKECFKGCKTVTIRKERIKS